ncbi:hypothetical protein COO60DRAFT_776758 [Scenedesmus sp. NREL 46B-D3]|nr:hypothetical protein COO60DRAFT_776758 [Scenedesmus sp. NREL 46B-D3]
MHFNTAQSRSAWTEQEDEMLRRAVAKFGDRAWATVANEVPGRSSKSCSDRWRNFLSPDIEHPRKSPFTEWECSGGPGPAPLWQQLEGHLHAAAWPHQPGGEEPVCRQPQVGRTPA